MEMGAARRSSILALAVLAASCGAKTGLLIPDASREPDAGMDADICAPTPLVLDRRGAQIMFVVDRSNSMADTLDGRDPGPGEVPRWDILRDTLEEVLNDADRLLEIGAEFYPRFWNVPVDTPEEACSPAAGIDLAPRRSNTDAFLALFTQTEPQGGTPTAAALREVRDFFAARPAPRVPRFVVLATDGGPNCNPDTGVHHSVCVCTGAPTMCTDSPQFGPYNCLDAESTVSVTTELAEGLGIPVYVIGIDDPNRGDLADVLDQIAVAGGRPREEPGERRFYSVRRPDDLRGALTTITDSISRCVFTVAPPAGDDDGVQVRVGEVFVPRDRTRTEGWDFTTPDGRELTLFGGACERVAATGEDVIAEVACPTEL